MTTLTDSTALPQRAAVTQGSGRGGLADFFRYHGVWAPGVRLFRSIGFRAKAIVISTAFAVPLALLTYCYVDDKAAAIAFSAKERVGVAYNREAVALLPVLHEQRLAAVKAALAGGGAAPAAPAGLDAVLKRVAAAEAQYGKDLDTAKAHGELLAKLRNLAPPSAGLDKVLATHNELTAAAVALITAATDNSNLTLDPDLDTYYLMDGSLGAMVAVLEATSLLRDMSLALAKGAPADGEFGKARFQQEVLGDVNDERWHVGMGKVATVHADIDKQIHGTEARKALHAFHELAESSKDPARIETEGTAVLTQLAAMQLRMIDKLDELLAARVDRMESARALVLGVLSASLLIVLYLFMSFRKVLDGGLREVAFHIDAMRDGDLTTHPRAWGNDEAANLMFTLAEMQQSLRRIVTHVRLASDQLVHSSSEISSASADLSQRTEQSAANLEETASAMEQIAATVRNNTETVDQATELAGANAGAADKGGRIIGEVMSTMQGINASSTRIGDIIGTIDGIAFQTNILALNAAVEAARAGEQGRGFAVVASEVRALAQRSSSAAREIKSLITTSMTQVDTGVRITRQASDSIGEVVSSAGRVRELLADVAVGAREQNAGVQQSAKAVQELDTVTQQNAALVEQTAAAAGALKAQALSLAGEVSRFKLPT